MFDGGKIRGILWATAASADLLGEWVHAKLEFRKMDLEIESGRVDLPPYGFPVRFFSACDVKMAISDLGARMVKK